MKRVVITGLGAITPIGNNIPDFWDALIHGKNGIAPITHFDTTDYQVKLAAEVKNFEPQQYYSDRTELRRTDTFTQYAMGAAMQAMADSGLESDNNIRPERLGVYIGSGIGGMNTFVAETLKLNERGPSRVSPFFIPSMIGNMASGTVAIRFCAQGPTLPVVTACATSTNTIGEAFHAIRYGYADAIIAGGTESTICPLATAGFTNSMALSKSTDPDRASIPFDAERNGFVMGEGAGIVILEEYEHAIARGAKIYAEICGYGNTCDAFHITSPSPEAEGASRAMKLAMEEAGINTDAKVYVNAHGTSTVMNDKTETLAIRKAFGADAEKVQVSSTKSMTGHMLGAAGGVEAIVCALALKNGILPPTINYRVPDADCNLDLIQNEARESKVTYTLSNSFGFGGHNACIALKTIY